MIDRKPLLLPKQTSLLLIFTLKLTSNMIVHVPRGPELFRFSDSLDKNKLVPMWPEEWQLLEVNNTDPDPAWSYHLTFRYFWM